MIHEYIIIDVETTGFNPREDRIWEVACLHISQGEIVNSFNQLINPLKPIPAKIGLMCGISGQDVTNMPVFSSIAKSLHDFISNKPLIAYNAPFDRRFLIKEHKGFSISKFYDYLTYIRDKVPNLSSYKLESLTDRYSIEHKSHRAMGDVMAIYKLIKIFGTPYAKYKI